MMELLDVVDELTLPKPVKIDQGRKRPDGSTSYTWVTEDALLVQLQEAVSSSLRYQDGDNDA